MTGLYLYDDDRARSFEPFALTRPVSELRAGVELIRRRWELALGVPAAGAVVAPHLADFEESGAPPASSGDVPDGAILANSRCVVALAQASRDASVWLCGGRVAAVRVPRDVKASTLIGGLLPLGRLAAEMSGRTAQIEGRWIDEVWDLIRELNAQLIEDIGRFGPQLEVDSGPSTAIGTGALFVERGATVEPFVVFDTTAGPILVRRGATVHSFTRVIGPCYVGEGSSVAGDKIASCSIGDVCRVHGEISSTILLGHANKGHDGFVGHSYLGRWVNLGAGTITSNLKNTYGSVALWTPTGIRDTGMQFLGTLFGDHAKTGIGTRLTTGTVIGAGANVFGSQMPPKAVPPFAWGDCEPYETYRADKFLEVAERAMSRRQVTLGERAKRQLTAAHARRWDER